MAPGLKRALDTLAYTVSAAVLGGGAVYVVHRLQADPSPPPPAPVVASAPAAPASPPAEAAMPMPAAAAESPPAATDPEPSPPPSAAAPMPAPAPAPAAAGVVTTATGSTYVLPAQSGSAEQDRSTYLALQRNCYDAAANNQTGQYPALQAAACNSYAQFAGEHGWNPGPMPAYGQPQLASAAPAYAAPAAASPDDSQNVVYDALLGRYRRVHRQQEAGSRHPIGPNYPLPPPQPQPPVSQEQHRSSVSRAATAPYRP